MPDTEPGGGHVPPPSTPPPSSPPPSTPPPSGGESPNRQIMLVLSYLGILALIPLLVEKEDREVQWHAKHGIILLIAWFVLFIALLILSAIIALIPFLGWIVSCVSLLVSMLLPLGILVIHIIAIVKALKGEKLRLPWISDFADQWK